MFMIVKIAWRNIWRNKTRSLIIIGAVTIGIWAALFLIAFSWGMSAQRISEAVENEIGHFQIHNSKFNEEDKDLNYAIKDGISIAGLLKEDTLIKEATARMVVPSMISSPVSSTGIEVDGIVPDEERIVTHLDQKVDTGSYFKDNEINQIIISRKLADQLSVGVGSKVVVSFQGLGQDILSGAFWISGIYQTHNNIYDRSHAFVMREDLQKLADSPHLVNEIAVKLNNIDNLDSYVAKFQKQHPQLLTETWGQIAPDLELVNSAFDQGMQIFVIIVMLALAFGIVNTMLMAVLERVRELGMLMAIGMNKWRVFAMIMLETIFLSLAGTPVGLLLSWLSILWFGKHGIDLSIVGEGLGTFGYGSMVYPEIASHFYVDVMIQVITVSVIAAIYPARKGLKLKPVEAIGQM